MIHFNQQIWKQEFISNEYDSAWRCGKCGIGSLKLVERIKYYSYAHCVLLRCSSSRCGMGYQVIGLLKPTSFGQEVLPTYQGIDDYQFHPSQFLPELVMFTLPSTMDFDIQMRLINSFNHFWYDLDACANKIRHAIELIIQEKGGKGASLHHQIRSLEGTLEKSLIEKLLALKWICNDGSHAKRPFTKDEILFAYSLLIDVLNQFYPDESEMTQRESLVQLINEKKGIKNR